MLSFGTCHGNRGGFTVCAVKNNLGILVVVSIPKHTRFELPFICCGGHFRNKCTVSVCVFKTTIMQSAEKMYQALLSATSNCLPVEAINGKREYAARTVRLIVSYCSNGKR